MAQSAKPLTRALFHDITSIVALTAAWHKVYGNRGCAGGDGVTLDAFASQFELRLARLSLELRNGLYRPGPLRRFPVAKKRGGVRTLAIPCIADRIAQTAAAAALGAVLEPHFEDSSYGYRPGRSARQAVARVAALRRAGYTWVVDGDIRAFFDSVPHPLLMEKLSRYVEEEPLLDLVALWLDSFDEGGRGIPQGSPISPLLANLHLDAVDEAIEQSGVRLVRFADDFVLLTRTERAAHGALDRMAALLAGHGLALNPEKTRVVAFEQAFRFLGSLFVRSIVLDDAAGEPPVYAPFEDAADDDGEEEAEEAPATVLAGGLVPARAEAEDGPGDPAAADDEDGVSAHGARVLYLMQPGRRLSAASEGFAVMEDDRELVVLPARRLGRIELGPAAAADHAALEMALAWRIPVFYLDGHGATLGRLAPALAERADLHLAQARCVIDPALRLALARTLVAGRLHNQHALLKRLNRRRKDARLEKACAVLSDARGKAAEAGSLDEARGHEGRGGAAYWPALGSALLHGWRLATRDRTAEDGPVTPVNAVLNWTAHLLARDLAALIGRVGLHPGFGALHASADGRQGCVYDLIEEFRAPLAEGLTVYLFNNRLLGRDDFSEGEDGTARVASGAGATLIRAWEDWLARPVASPRRTARLSWRALMEEQARAFARTMTAGEAYEPYAMDY